MSRDKVIAIRRDIHKHPETGFDVERTAAIVARELKSAGIEVKEGIAKTGVQGDLHVPGATFRIALRADMDALPMQELANPPYKSTVDGKAHMCGHDAHTAMLIGAAHQIAAMGDRLSCHVRFIFQPSEEALPGGAPGMIEGGVLEGVDEIYALHVWPELPVGTIGVCEGPAMAQSDVFGVEVLGRGGHAAAPHKTVDPLLIAAHIVTALQTIVSRTVDPLESAVLSVTQLHGGTADNVIAHAAHIRGTVRTYQSFVQKRIRERLEAIVKQISEAFGGTSHVEYREGYPVTVNHGDQVQKVLAAAASQGLLTDYPSRPMLGGEDFAYYLQKVPGAFIKLGCRNEKMGRTFILHDPRFDIDEACLEEGVRLFVQLVS